MSKKRKLAQENLIQVVEKVKAQESTFNAFFHLCVAKGLVNDWQENEIHAFFRTLGLKDKEPIDSYEDALSKY